MEKPTLPVAGMIAVKTIEGYIFLELTQIIRIEADSKHTLIYSLDQPRAIRSVSPLSVFEARLTDELFFKCHRSQIINLRHIKKFAWADRKIFLANNHVVKIAEDRVHEFLLCTDPAFGGKL